jgi:hypothetical protein
LACLRHARSTIDEEDGPLLLDQRTAPEHYGPVIEAGAARGVTRTN